jgi:hypothetical protein
MACRSSSRISEAKGSFIGKYHAQQKKIQKNGSPWTMEAHHTGYPRLDRWACFHTNNTSTPLFSLYGHNSAVKAASHLKNAFHLKLIAPAIRPAV